MVLQKVKDIISGKTKYMSDEDWKIFCNYKHSAGKTAFEIIMLENVSSQIEQKVLPQSWSPNTITFIGNVGITISGLMCMFFGGLSYSGDYLPPWLLFFGAFTVEWFSVFDMMDGQRAKRLKCGTPIGRIIDEAGDAMVYTWAAHIIGYVFNLPPGLFCLSYCVINLPMYTMEIKHLITGKLSITAGSMDIGPVEIEVILTAIICVGAIYGGAGVHSPFNDILPGFASGLVSNEFLVMHFIGLFGFLLQGVFILENFVGAFVIDQKNALYIIASPMIGFAIACLSAYLGSWTYTNNFVIFHLLHSWCFNCAGLRLQIANMVKRSHKDYTFSLLGYENILATLPLVFHLVSEQTRQFEPLVSKVCAALLWIFFYGQIYSLSQQWLKHEGGKREWWSIAKFIAAREKQE